MTIGVTGVVWMPRGATVNSTTLSAGAGPVPLGAASPAWAALSASLADAGATLNRVMTELRAGWEGVAADAALARLAPFTAWVEQSAALAAETSTKASTQAGSYTTAAMTMPSLPEITAVKAAKTAAYSTGGVVNGSAAAAEAADRAMDFRAGVVMEVYEAASSIVTTPETFTQPPPLSNGAAAGLDAGDAGEVSRRRLEDDFRTDPVGTVAAVATTFAQSPGAATAASQIGSAAGAVSSATSAAANIGGAVLGGFSGSAPALSGTGPAGTTGGARPAGSRSGAAGASGLFGPAASRAAGIGSGAGAALPEGWTQAGQLDGSGARGGTGHGGAAAGPGSVAPSDTVRTDAAAATARNQAAAGAPAMAPRGAADADDPAHNTPDYLRSFEHFTDGRTVIPSVIGADADEDGR